MIKLAASGCPPAVDPRAPGQDRRLGELTPSSLDRGPRPAPAANRKGTSTADRDEERVNVGEPADALSARPQTADAVPRCAYRLCL